jgi:hypothetical protein
MVSAEPDSDSVWRQQGGPFVLTSTATPWPELRQIRTMTADMAERRLNCIGWPLRDGAADPSQPPARRRSGWGFLLQDMRRK